MSKVILRGDSNCGVESDSWQSEDPTAEQLEDRLLRLDQGRFTILTIAHEASEAHLAVGGGSGQFVVYMTADNQRFWNLVDPTASEARTMLTAGGQQGDYPARTVVDATTALAAAEHYRRTSVRNPELSWEEQE